jgi:hypothetical protein
MHIFKVNPEVIIPNEEIMMVMLNSKRVLASFQMFQVQFMKCAHLRGYVDELLTKGFPRSYG